MFVFTTLLPLASIILARLQPRRLLRTCPRCNGLLVFGEEYSIITSGEFSSAVFSPNFPSAWMSLSSPTHAAGATTRFRKPFTTLNELTALQLAARYSPISCAVSSGFFLDIFRNGNTTSVRLPSKVLFVFCSCTIFPGTSCPYSSLMAAITELHI